MPAKCGDRLVEERRGPLRLTGSFPARVPATGRGFGGRVTVANGSDRRAGGLAASRPDLYVLRAGRVVAMPLARDEVGLQLDLAPGEGQDLAAAGSLASCRDGRPLAPGRYEIRAVLPVIGLDGTAGAAAGGPWALEVV